ncbi:uncharacterized protein STEHIDRAFT_164140 [Stereum hirsutum FP-91666 SS1]|uniref:Uncharacterized protein n=1 Tax=Stereum hirsutum (strain FP-91666) TaxID=721885 RepID=R7RVG2_STEHR|nr:uncharacterized protein STEHIDRAFT_164140 [Stereum hirsutum FP-91666 SS1]EIM78974.1 hypothetical protein STEHIDRAFT_164140 [Stereum hirsutum FP-91666 SS1]
MISTITPAERRLAQCLHDDIAVLRYYGKGLMTAVSHNTIPRIFGPQDVMRQVQGCEFAHRKTRNSDGGCARAKDSGTAGFCMLAAWAIDEINEVDFDQLQSLFDIYPPFVEDWIKLAVSEVLSPLANVSTTSYHSHGLDVYSWLTGASPVRPVSYLAFIPVSLPPIGLTQFVQYLIVPRVSGLSYTELNSRLAGTTGHLQGTPMALPCWSPALALEPSVVEESIEGGEGSPTSMLSVVGLLLKDLEPHVAETNKHLPSNSQLHIPLHNGAKAFVVTGPPRVLYGVVPSLRKVKAPSGVDQSKTPFSQRKPVFYGCFLTMKDEELWDVKYLNIPVFHTEDGYDPRELSTSLTRSICDQIFTSPKPSPPLSSASSGRSTTTPGPSTLWYGRRACTHIRKERMASIYDKALKRKDFSGIVDPGCVGE